jgi:hypothetical protein
MIPRINSDYLHSFNPLNLVMEKLCIFFEARATFLNNIFYDDHIGARNIILIIKQYYG